VIQVDLYSYPHQGLLDTFDEENGGQDDLTQYFHVVESAEKVISCSIEQFVIWSSSRRTKYSLHLYFDCAESSKHLNLEIVFSTAGVYNNIPDTS
jgi:hypothetical protein